MTSTFYQSYIIYNRPQEDKNENMDLKDNKISFNVRKLYYNSKKKKFAHRTMSPKAQNA